jgi:hypothetical protein
MFDEGIVLSDTMIVLHGQIIHRDFYSLYGPGRYYVIATLFQLFDKDFAAQINARSGLPYPDRPGQLLSSSPSDPR